MAKYKNGDLSRNPACLVPWGVNSLLKLGCTLFLCRIIISHCASNWATIPCVQFFVYRWCFFILIRMPANTSISSCELCLSFIHGFSLLVELLCLSCVKLVPIPSHSAIASHSLFSNFQKIQAIAISFSLFFTNLIDSYMRSLFFPFLFLPLFLTT